MSMKKAVAQAEDLVPGVWELASMALAIQEAIYRGDFLGGGVPGGHECAGGKGRGRPGSDPDGGGRADQCVPADRRVKQKKPLAAANGEGCEGYREF